MNYRLVKMVKSEYEGISDLLDSFEKSGLVENPYESLTLNSIFRLDVAKFLMYLSAADGRIHENEVLVYQTITGYSDDENEIIEFIKKNGIYSTQFESTVPESLKMAVQAQYKLLTRVNKMESDSTLPELYVSFFETLGTLVMQADDGVTYNERRDFTIYIKTLKEYLRERGF